MSIAVSARCHRDRKGESIRTQAKEQRFIQQSSNDKRQPTDSNARPLIPCNIIRVAGEAFTVHAAQVPSASAFRWAARRLGTLGQTGKTFTAIGRRVT